MSPELAKRWAEEVEEDYLPAGVCIRNAFCKGMAFTFDPLKHLLVRLLRQRK